MVALLDELSILEGSAEKSPGLNPALQTVCWRDLPVLVVLLGDGAHPVPVRLCGPGDHPEPQVCQHNLLLSLPSHPHKLNTLGDFRNEERPGSCGNG